MELTLRQRIFLIVGAILATLAIILTAGYYLNKKPVDVAPPPEEKTTPPPVPVNNLPPSTNGTGSVAPAKPITTANGSDIYMRQLAGIFVERFASYSNQNDNKHIEDSLILATPSMQNWMKKQALTQSLEYQGVTTKVISAFLQSKDKDKAMVEFTAQQVLEKNDPSSNAIQKEIKQRKGRVELVKISGDWKINGMWWE